MEEYCTAGQATGDNIIWTMRFACWINKATETHSKYVILIALPRQQLLRERNSMLRYAFIAYLVTFTTCCGSFITPPLLARVCMCGRDRG